MKKLYSLALAVLAVSCGPQIDLTERPLFRDGVNTVTFMLYNALTGEPINIASVATPTATVTMTMGSYSLPATPQEGTNILVVSQVPGGTHLTTVKADGFVDFQGQASSPCSYDIRNYTGPEGACFRTYQVALFPNGSVSQAVTVRAYESATGRAVASGTAVATLTNAGALVGFTNPLPGTLTSRPNTIVRQLDANGSATFEAANLVLGGTYSVDVFNASNADGDVLTPEENETFVAGESFNQLTLFMGPPSEWPVALSTSYENNTHSTPQTSFWVEFPYLVEVCSDRDDHFWGTQFGYGNADADANFVAAAPDPVGVGIGTTGNITRLTLTPAMSVPADPDDGHLDITIYNVAVRVVGSSTCVDLFSVDIRNGSGVNPTLHHVNAP